eukprot:scaffold4189_cov86-Cylindrotheca_fusiformis.AAC.5
MESFLVDLLVEHNVSASQVNMVQDNARSRIRQKHNLRMVQDHARNRNHRDTQRHQRLLSPIAQIPKKAKAHRELDRADVSMPFSLPMHHQSRSKPRLGARCN